MRRMYPIYEDDLDARVQVKHEQARKDGQPMNGSWSGSNSLGYEIPFDLSTSRPQGILRLPEWNMPSGWILSVMPRIETANQQPLGAGDAFDAVLEVEYGSGGVMQNFECDLIVGTRISLPCNTVVLKARLAQADANSPVGTVHLNAILARGYARSHCTRSFLFSAAQEGGVSSWFEIPRFARSVHMVGIAASANVYQSLVELQMSPNTSGASVRIAGNFFPAGPGTKQPIPAFQRYARVENNGTNPISGFLVFNLFTDF